MTSSAPSWREIGVRLLHVARIIYQRSAWRRWQRRRFSMRRLPAVRAKRAEVRIDDFERLFCASRPGAPIRVYRHLPEVVQ